MSEIKLFNTLSGKKEVFEPLVPGEVKMYHCGPTVYDYAHIGNMRSFLLADFTRRLFEINQYNVVQVMNITDVGHLVGDGDEGEDKMEYGADREHTTAQEIAARYTKVFFDDIALLNIKTEDTEFPAATEHIEEQIALIQKLEERGFTYKISDGIYFDTSRFPQYGQLGNINLEGLEEGARVAKNVEKKNPTDFALWKFSPEESRRQQEWPSPWGVGFPGWHIECSAMSMKYLGETFDVHTGGVDHIPVHHNGEIAQSEAATGKPFVHYWLHGAFMTIEGEKMSKSLGNTFRLQDLIDRNLSPRAFRLWVLGGHYRTPMNFTWDALSGNQIALSKLERQFRALEKDTGRVSIPYQKKFLSLISDDLQTPQALALVWELLGDGEVSDPDKRASLLYFDKFLGLGLENLPEIETPEEILNLAEQREAARKAGNFAEADLIRKQIEEKGFTINDTPEGPKVHTH